MMVKKKKSGVIFALVLFCFIGVFYSTKRVLAYEISGFYQYENNDTGVTITKYTGGELNVKIPSKIKDKKVTAIGMRAFANNDIIENVEIPNTITIIGGGAFYDCDSLQKIIIPDSVTTIEAASYGNFETFGYCESLTTVVIGNSVTALNDNCFIECPKLENVTIGKNVSYMGNSVFNNCDNLKNITIPASVKSIGIHCFKDCDKLQNIILNEGLEIINGGAFHNCDSLEEIIIPDSVTTIESTSYGNFETFGYCNNLTTVVIGDSLKGLNDNSFIECPKLENVTIGKSVSYIANSVFNNCDSLSSIIIPASVKRLGLHCFADCDKLQNVTLNYGLETITGGAFFGCDSLQEIIIPNSVINLDSANYGNFEIFGMCTSLMTLKIPNSVSNIGDNLVGKSDYVVIQGYAGSAIAKYALDNNILFQELPSLPANHFSFDKSEILMMVGEKHALNYSIKPENTTDAIVWLSSDNNIATIDNIGVVTAHKSGSVSIIGTTTSGKKGSITIIVEDAPKSISFKGEAKTLAVKQSYTQKAIIDDGSRTDVQVTYTSSNPAIASVDYNGKVMAKKVGTVTITAEIFNGLKATYGVTVKNEPSKVTLKESTLTLKVKDTYTLKPIVSSDSYTSKYTFKSSNTSVLTVDSKGKISPKKKGTATITVTTHNKKTVTCKVTVK